MHMAGPEEFNVQNKSVRVRHWNTTKTSKNTKLRDNSDVEILHPTIRSVLQGSANYCTFFFVFFVGSWYLAVRRPKRV